MTHALDGTATSRERLASEIIVIGSGAGGAVTAALLAENGYEVLVIEEGPDLDTATISTNSTDAILKLYRNGGLTPILGNQSIAFVEGRCVGGSTEINSGFWHRLPDECYHRWKADFLVDGFRQEVIDAYFERIESDLNVSRLGPERETKGSALLRRGAQALDWKYEEVPRCQKNPAVSAFAPGAKQSMQRTYLPRASEAGARLLANCKVRRIEISGGRAVGVRAILDVDGQPVEKLICADAVFLCCGAIQTPALLRRSGIRKNVGDRLRIHPMIKAAALFDEEVDTREAPIPMYQVKEFRPSITIGGSVFSPGFLAMLLADNWSMNQEVMRNWDRMGMFYAATRGLGRGIIRGIPGTGDGVVVRYWLSTADQRNLSIGLARLGELLFAAGARAVYPSLRSFPVLHSAEQCRSFLEAYVPVSAMSLSTVHAFSSCPMGENPDLCVTDSFGRLRGFENLYVNDASLIPDSPGVNPQGTTMALSFRNAEHFVEEPLRMRRRPAPSGRGELRRAKVLVTGAPGWLGTRLIELLHEEEGAQVLPPDAHVRCLFQPGADTRPLSRVSERVDLSSGDLRNPDSLRAFCQSAEQGVLFHIAGVVHPRRAEEFETVNVEGTRTLLSAAREAGIRRVVVMSSNSPIGCNPARDHLFDESSPYNPYMGYGRSKAKMEQLVNYFEDEGGVETVIVRAPWFYGPHQPPRQTQFFRMIKEGRFPILGDGGQKRSMAYVDNLCQGLFLAALTERARGETYWIADAQPYSINEIVDTVERVLEHDFGIRCTKRRLRLPSLFGELAERIDSLIQTMGLYQQQLHVLGEMNKTIACSIGKAKTELGYVPRYALREGMAESVRWCLENGQYL